MLPDIWGNYGWKFLHLITFNYPENPTTDDKTKYYNFFYWLQYVLPCETCQQNMTIHLQTHPLTAQVLSSRANLVKWLIDIHNVVNFYTKKRMLSYDEAICEIESWTKQNNSGNRSTCRNIVIVGLVALIVIIVCIYYKYSKKLIF